MKVFPNPPLDFHVQTPMKGRITIKRLMEFVNQQLENTSLDGFKAVSGQRMTRTQDQAESGAAAIVITIENPNYHQYLSRRHVYCEYTLRQLEDHVKQGYVITLEWPDLKRRHNLEIDLQKYLSPNPFHT